MRRKAGISTAFATIILVAILLLSLIYTYQQSVAEYRVEDALRTASGIEERRRLEDLEVVYDGASEELVIMNVGDVPTKLIALVEINLSDYSFIDISQLDHYIQPQTNISISLPPPDSGAVYGVVSNTGLLYIDDILMRRILENLGGGADNDMLIPLHNRNITRVWGLERNYAVVRVGLDAYMVIDLEAGEVVSTNGTIPLRGVSGGLVRGILGYTTIHVNTTYIGAVYNPVYVGDDYVVGWTSTPPHTLRVYRAPNGWIGDYDSIVYNGNYTYLVNISDVYPASYQLEVWQVNRTMWRVIDTFYINVPLAVRQPWISPTTMYIYDDGSKPTRITFAPSGGMNTNWGRYIFSFSLVATSPAQYNVSHRPDSRWVFYSIAWSSSPSDWNVMRWWGKLELIHSGWAPPMYVWRFRTPSSPLPISPVQNPVIFLRPSLRQGGWVLLEDRNLWGILINRTGANTYDAYLTRRPSITSQTPLIIQHLGTFGAPITGDAEIHITLDTFTGRLGLAFVEPPIETSYIYFNTNIGSPAYLTVYRPQGGFTNGLKLLSIYSRNSPDPMSHAYRVRSPNNYVIGYMKPGDGWGVAGGYTVPRELAPNVEIMIDPVRIQVRNTTGVRLYNPLTGLWGYSLDGAKIYSYEYHDVYAKPHVYVGAMATATRDYLVYVVRDARGDLIVSILLNP